MKICLQVAQNTRSLPPRTIIDMSPNQQDAGTIEGSDADRPQLDLWGSDLLVAEEDSDTVRSAALQSLEAAGVEAEGERVDILHGFRQTSFLRGASHTFAPHVCPLAELVVRAPATSDNHGLAPTSDAALDATVEERAAVKAALIDHLTLIGHLDKVTGEVVKNAAGEFPVGYTGQTSQAPLSKASKVKNHLGYDGILRKINMKKYGITLNKRNISKFEAILNMIKVDPDCPNSA